MNSALEKLLLSELRIVVYNRGPRPAAPNMRPRRAAPKRRLTMENLPR